MKAKLKVIKNWEFEEFELTGTSFKYSPTGCKGMVARSEDEIVFWTYHLYSSFVKSPSEDTIQKPSTLFV